MKKKLISIFMSMVMIINMAMLIPFAASAGGDVGSNYFEELQTLTKQYLMYATGENSLQLNASNVRLDGNLYTGGNLDAYSGRVDIYGKAEVVGHVNKHQHTIFNRLQYVGELPPREYAHFTQAVVDSLGNNYAT